jgi:DNA-binding transcriptional MerR regulator
MTEDRILRTASEVSEMLSLQESTLRKYCIALEEAGHKFMKNKRGHRSFSNNDITILQRFISAKESPAMTLKKAAYAVVSVHNDNSVTDSVPETIPYNESSELSHTMQDWKEMFMKQQQMTSRLLEKLEEQEEREKERMEHEKELMALLKEARADRSLPEAHEQTDGSPEERAAVEETEEVTTEGAPSEETFFEEENIQDAEIVEMEDAYKTADEEEGMSEAEESAVTEAAEALQSQPEENSTQEPKKPWWMFWK